MRPSGREALLDPTRPKLAQPDWPSLPRPDLRRGGEGAALGLSGLSVLVCLFIMPLVYGVVAFHGALVEMLKAPVLEHVAFNCAANLFVMLTAIGLKGRLDHKITAVSRHVLMAHGTVAFFTLIFRHYYSIPMLLTGIATSSVLGVAVTYVRHRVTRLRIGVLGPWRPILSEADFPFEVVEGPQTDISRFDLLIIPSVDDLSPEWIPTLSRALLAGQRVRHAAEYIEECRGMVSIEDFAINQLPERGLANYRIPKRVLDIALVTISLPITLPILALASLAVVAVIGRPVIFVQPRVGQGGRVFNMFKLRTMPPPRKVGGATVQADARIAPVSQRLRQRHLDELPQMWNVLIGDMSIVGPRPEQPALADSYTRQIPAFTYRQLVRPGITGWAQVRAGYAADLAETRVKLGYDLFYLKNFSFALDLRILVRTCWTLVHGGAR
jgi:lipopolysaccharide/colanic/teichoic acid biosynthesis glycosyltransferase